MDKNRKKWKCKGWDTYNTLGTTGSVSVPPTPPFGCETIDTRRACDAAEALSYRHLCAVTTVARPTPPLPRPTRNCVNFLAFNFFT